MASNGSTAIEKADPTSNLDAGKGQVPIHSFNPHASPEEKAAVAGQSRDKLKSIKPDSTTKLEAKDLDVDTGGSHIIPTITIDDVDEGHLETVPDGPQEPSEEEKPEAEQHPGTIPTHLAKEIPDWYRIGWRQVSRIDEVQHEDRSILDDFLAEQYYGDWYHNAGVIVFGVIASHFLARFNFGWGWVFILLAICSSYYGTSVKRLRQRARDKIQRELVKTRLASETETADWLNNFLDRFWVLYEPVLSQSIVATVDHVLSTTTPAFLDSMRLSEFTLGNKAPRIESVRTFPNTEEDVVIMNWAISFTPNDVSNMTPRQAAKKRNPKIVLDIRVGRGLATAGMPILVEDITFKGFMKFRLKLMSNFPHVQIVDFSFTERPRIDFVLKPIGGDTFGFDIANIPGLSSFIHEMIHSNLSPMMYDPSFFTINLEQMLSGKPLDTAIGVIRVTLSSARGIKTTKIGGGTPDPYVSLNIENRTELARTKYKPNTSNPTWMETKFVLVNNLHEDFQLNVYDYNEHRKDSLLGTTTFKLKTLQDDAAQENITSRLLKDGKDAGELKYDVSYYPVLTPEEKDGRLLETNVGIVRLVIHQAKDLDHSHSISGDLNPMVKVHLGDKRTAAYKTPVKKHTNDPVWEAAYEFLCLDKMTSKIVVRVIDDRDFLKDPEVGYMSIRLTDLLACNGQAGKDWFRLSNCESGKIRVSAEWKSLNLAGALVTPERYTPPIGVIRLHLDKATDVKNVEATLGGKSDPYVRVLVNSIVKGRTEVINNNLNPVWDQIIYIPVHSLRGTLLLECMDYQHLTKDRSLGSVEINVSELAKTSDNSQYPFESTGVQNRASQILVERDEHKGVMHYSAEFVPAMQIKDAIFKPRPNELLQAAHNGTEPDTRSISSGFSIGSSEDDYWPTDVTIRMSNESLNASEDAAASAQPEKVDNAPVGEEDKGVEMNVDELLTHQSGIILFNVLSGQLNDKARLEVLVDDGYWPSFSTTRAGSTNARWDQIGEGFMKELDFGYVWLRLNEANEGDKDDIIGVWKQEAKTFLEKALTAPQTFTLFDPKNDSKAVASVVVEARYVPVPIKLEPRETVNNQGILRVLLINGHDIVAADRSGKSDPFVVFTLNGHKVIKSQVKKKTLDPEWGEEFETEITSRVHAEFSLEVFDWNQVEQSKSLGTGSIDLVDLEPFQATDQVIKLISPKHGEKGQIRVNLLFTPKIIAKSRKNTSTFTSAGRTMTQIGALPVTAGKGVIQGVTGVFKRGDRDQEPTKGIPIPPAPAAQALPVQTGTGTDQAQSLMNMSVDNVPAVNQEPGLLRIVVENATLSYESKAYVVLRVGDKEVKTKHSTKTAHPEWNETFSLPAGPRTPKLFAWVHDHKTLGRDKDLGEVDVDLWTNLKLQGHSTKKLTLPIRQGSLNLLLEFDSEIHPSNSNGSVSSADRMHRTISFTSPSRFSIRGRRAGSEDD